MCLAKQILFVRMSVTTLGITLWLWKQQKPSNILGKKENRLLLLVRAFGGFLGVFGLYCMSFPPVLSCMHATLQARAHHVAADSLRSLNLSEATVITFMMPLVASFGGYLLLGSSISRIEILLSVLSLFGVVLVASPDALFPASEATVGSATAVSTVERVWALCVGLLGVCGSAAAFLSMSTIGKTEDPLTVVNYFAAMCTVVSCIALIVLPGLGFQAPGDIWEWALLFFSGLSGFLMVGCPPDVQASGFSSINNALTMDTAAIPHYVVAPSRKVTCCRQHGIHPNRFRTRSRRHRLPYHAA